MLYWMLRLFFPSLNLQSVEKVKGIKNRDQMIMFIVERLLVEKLTFKDFHYYDSLNIIKDKH